MRNAVIAATVLSLAVTGGAFAQTSKIKPRWTPDAGGAARTVESPSATPAAESGPPTRGAARTAAPSATAATPPAAASPSASSQQRGAEVGAPGTDPGKGAPGAGGSPPPTLPSTGDASTPPPGSKTPPAA